MADETTGGRGRARRAGANRATSRKTKASPNKASPKKASPKKASPNKASPNKASPKRSPARTEKRADSGEGAAPPGRRRSASSTPEPANGGARATRRRASARRAPDAQPLNLARIVDRLWRTPRGWAVDELCEELEISDRTYRKYRRNLQLLFKPWQRQDGATRLVEEREGDRRYLRLREAAPDSRELEAALLRLVALQLAGEAFAFLGDGELGEALPDVVRQVRTTGQERFPMAFQRLRSDLDRLLVYVPFGARRYDGKEEVLRAILKSIVFTRAVELRYDAASGKVGDHLIEPLSLLLHQGGLHLLARYPGKTKVYDFVLDRIQSARPAQHYFMYPDREEYDPRALYQGVFGVFREPTAQAPLEVALRFAAIKWLKQYVREREWQAGQVVADLPDGRLELRFRVTSLVEVVPWVLQFGDDVEVLGPEPLRDAVASARQPGAGGRRSPKGRAPKREASGSRRGRKPR